MIPYFSRRIEANEVGLRIIEIECEKCNCRYGYELARMGTGHGVAHYGIGTNSAAQSARAGSLVDLQSRLTQEAELVPCPQCQWVSRALLQGYRRGLYRGSGWLALGIAGLGSLAS